MSRPNDIAHRIVMTEFAMGIVDDPPKGRVVDPFRGADTAQTIAEQGSVLLKNAAPQLPLSASQVTSIAIIGSHADTSVLSEAVPRRWILPAAAPADLAGRRSGSLRLR